MTDHKTSCKVFFRLLSISVYLGHSSTVFYNISNGFIIAVDSQCFYVVPFELFCCGIFSLSGRVGSLALSLFLCLPVSSSYMSSTRFGWRRCGASRCLAVRNDHDGSSFGRHCAYVVSAHHRTTGQAGFCYFVFVHVGSNCLLTSPPKGQCSLSFLPNLECCGQRNSFCFLECCVCVFRSYLSHNQQSCFISFTLRTISPFNFFYVGHWD